MSSDGDSHSGEYIVPIPHPSLDWVLSMPGAGETTPEATWDSENKMKAATSSLCRSASVLALIIEHLPCVKGRFHVFLIYLV